MPFENPSPFYIQPRALDYAQTNIAVFNASAIIDVPIDTTAPVQGDVLRVNQSTWTPVDSSAIMVRTLASTPFPIGTTLLQFPTDVLTSGQISYSSGTFTVGKQGVWLITANANSLIIGPNALKYGVVLRINGITVLQTSTSQYINNVSHCVMLDVDDTISFQIIIPIISDIEGDVNIYYLFE